MTSAAVVRATRCNALPGRRLSQRALLSAILLAALSGAAMAQEYCYAVIKLPSLNEVLASDGVGGMNAFGDVVGGAPSESIWDSRAVFWPAEGGVVDLGTLGGDLAGAADINDLGEIVGSSGFEPGGSIFVGRAFLWRNGEMFDLGTLGGESSGAVALNNRSQVVGNSEFEFDNHQAVGFVWERGEMRVLDDPWPDRNATDVWGINEHGEIVGKGLNIEGQQRALLWIDEIPIDLGTLADGNSVAYAINDLGQIIGRSGAANGNDHAVVWIDHQIVDIHDARYGAYSWGQDINNAGQVIGAIGDLAGSREMFIRELGQPMRLLKDLIPPRTREDWRLDRGHINDAGQISVTANIRDSIDRFALLLTPVRSTMLLQNPWPGSAGRSNRLHVSGCTPGATVHFLYSRHGGGTRIPGCDLQQNALQLDNPTVIGSAVADENGVATITRTVPLVARGRTILFQAVVQGECAISQLVVHEFE